MRNKFFLFFFIISCVLFPASAFSIEYPRGVPDGEVEGGVFMRFFKNIFIQCPEWEAVVGFTFDPNNLKHPDNGKPKCKKVASDTEDILQKITGTAHFLPKWDETGTKFVASKIFQLADNIGIGTKTPSAPLEVIGKILVSRINGPKLSLGVSESGNDVIIGNTSENGKILFRWGENLQNFADIGAKDGIFKGRVKIEWGGVTNGNNSGAFLMQGPDGFSSWKHLKDFGLRPCRPTGEGNNNLCYGDNSLILNTTWRDNTAYGFFALQQNTTGDTNAAFGNYALQSNTTGNGNVAIGRYSLGSNTTGSYNISIGLDSMLYNKTGVGNVSVGLYSLRENTSGNHNSALGFLALQKNTTGSNNIANGSLALGENTTGNHNIAIGQYSLRSNHTGSYNIALGEASLSRNTVSNNVAIGKSSMQENTTGKDNIAIGGNTLLRNATGSYNLALGNNALQNNLWSMNIALGDSALNKNERGENNVAIGWWALSKNYDGDLNLAIGVYSLRNNTIGSQNVSIGPESMANNTSGRDNISLGTHSLLRNESGRSNVSIGSFSLRKNTIGNNNISLGLFSLQNNTTGSNNISLGNTSLWENTTGDNNISIGILSLTKNTTGSGNIALGRAVMRNNVTGDLNTALGVNTLDDNVSGNRNTAIGVGAMTRIREGNSNIALGDFSADKLISGSGNIAIGEQANFANPNGSNQLNIANAIYGNDIWGGDAKIGIGTNKPQAKLDILGNIKITDGTQWSGKVLVSDAQGNARWESITTGVGTNPNDCSSTIKQVNSHSYPVIALTNGNGYIASFIENIANGKRQWTQEFYCNRGDLAPRGGEQSNIVCNNGFVSNGAACIDATPPTPIPEIPKNVDCSPMQMVVNGRNYNVGALKNNFSTVVNATETIDNGIKNYKQTFVCSNALLTTNGPEEFISTKCNSGFSWNGNACVAENSAMQMVVEAFSGTTCQASNIRVESVRPGENTIKENLDANTLYQLEAGEYNVSRTINMGTCSAIVGAGTGNTVIQYSGISFGTESLIASSQNNAVIDNLSLVGTTADAGKVATVINFSEGRKSKLTRLDISEATENGIIWNVTSGFIKTLKISSISSQEKEISGIIIKNAHNTLSDISISNVSLNKTIKSSNNQHYSRGIYIYANNNSLSDISIRDISSFVTKDLDSASYYSYGIDMKYGTHNNSLSDISISNITSSDYSYGISLTSSNSSLSDISISNITSSSRYYSFSYGIVTDSNNDINNNSFSNISISNINSSAPPRYSSSSYGIKVYNNNSFRTIKIVDVYASGSSGSKNFSYGLHMKNKNFISNMTIYNIWSKNSWEDIAWILVSGSENTINNAIVAYSDKWGIKNELSAKNNFYRNMLVFNNKGDGISLEGSNNVFSYMYIYNNGEKAVDGNGPSNYYYDTLMAFDNGSANTILPLNRGRASHWISGFGDSLLSYSGKMGADWVIRPSFSGWDVMTRGYQKNIDWTQKYSSQFGAKIPLQKAPILPSDCTLSVSSLNPCAPTFWGVNTYDSLKRIGEW